MNALGLLISLMLLGQSQPASSAFQPPKLTLAMTLRVQVGAPMELGEVPRGRRRIIPILGGTFEGPNIRGKVLPGGADWQVVRADGLAELDARYALQTEQGSLIYIQNAGMRHAPPDVTKKLLAGEAVDPAQVYFQDRPDVRDVSHRAAVADARDLRRHRRALSDRGRDSRLEGGLTSAARLRTSPSPPAAPAADRRRRSGGTHRS